MPETPVTIDPEALSVRRRGAVTLLLGGGALVAMATPAAAQFAARGSRHKVAILIDTDDDKVMGHAISYTMNLSRAYGADRQSVAIEVIANGSGIKLLRFDTSPLQEPLALVRRAVPNVVLSMCDSSRQIAEAKEGKSIELVSGARLVPFGIRRLVELQEAGWSYIHG